MAAAESESVAVAVMESGTARKELVALLGNVRSGAPWEDIVAAVRELMGLVIVATEATNEYPEVDVRFLADALKLLDEQASTGPFTFTGSLVMVDEDGDEIVMPVRYSAEAERHFVRMRPGLAP